MNTMYLITALESAKWGSHDLTADVYETLGWPVKRAGPGRTWAYLSYDGPSPRWCSMSDYTRSRDAASKLVRKTMEELGYRMFEVHGRIVHDSHGPTAFMEITIPSREFRAVASGPDAEARALVAACLRARHALEQDAT